MSRHLNWQQDNHPEKPDDIQPQRDETLLPLNMCVNAVEFVIGVQCAYSSDVIQDTQSRDSHADYTQGAPRDRGLGACAG